MSFLEEESAVPGLLVVLLRALRHWSQAELARASGIQKSQISLYERWKTVPSEINRKRLAAAAGIVWVEACQALPALRTLYRLAAHPAGHAPALPGARRLAATVGLAAAGAFRERVGPFLGRYLPLLALSGTPAPVLPPDRGTESAALGLWIVLLRSLRHWSQEELASASGVQRSQISAYELGRKKPKRRTLERLAGAVGVPMDEALAVLPFLRTLVWEARGRRSGRAGLAGGLGRFAEDCFLLTAELAGPMTRASC